MLALLGSLIAIGAALTFAAVGLLTLWAGRASLDREVARDFVRSPAPPARRALAVALVAVPLVLTGLFGLLAAGRILMVAIGLG
jgi:hypothetical protein